MAQLQPTQLTIPAATIGPLSIRGGGAHTNIVTMQVAVSRGNWSRALCERQGTVRATSTDQEPAAAFEKQGEDKETAAAAAEADFPPFDFYIKKRAAADDGEIEFFVEECGWKVRRMGEEESEIRKVAKIQAEAFHEPAAIFNDWFFYVFQAEVLSGLLYRLRNSPPNRYACLVAELANNESEVDDDGTATGLVGVVDLMALRDSDVLRLLDGANQYLYVSGIAVSKNHRRKKVATALLKACEAISNLWGFDYLALRAYEDDLGARALYTNAGYRVVSRDPPWLGWIGRKRRILMIKRSALSTTDAAAADDDDKNHQPQD